jgi:hypothetical protein
MEPSTHAKSANNAFFLGSIRFEPKDLGGGGGGDFGPCTLQVLYLIFFLKKTLFYPCSYTTPQPMKKENLET